jgi:hypothetical protein
MDGRISQTGRLLPTPIAADARGSGGEREVSPRQFSANNLLTPWMIVGLTIFLVCVTLYFWLKRSTFEP